MLLCILILAVRLLDVSFQSAGISRATDSEGSILSGRPMPIVVAVTVSACHTLRLIRSNLSISLDLTNSNLTSTSNMSLLSTPKTTLLISEGGWAISNPMPLTVLARKSWEYAGIQPTFFVTSKAPLVLCLLRLPVFSLRLHVHELTTQRRPLSIPGSLISRILTPSRRTTAITISLSLSHPQFFFRPCVISFSYSELRTASTLHSLAVYIAGTSTPVLVFSGFPRWGLGRRRWSVVWTVRTWLCWPVSHVGLP